MSDGGPLVSLDRVSVARTGRSDPVLDELSLTIGEGETVVLLGEESSGGSAVLRAIANANDRDENVTGAIAYRSHQTRIAYLPSAFSQPLSPARGIVSQLARVIARKFSIPRMAAREELRSVLAKLEGAPPFEALAANPNQVEPAVLAWALLAGTLAQAPDLILADDPVRGLSPMTAHALTSTLLDHRRRLGAALLYNALALDPAVWASGRVIILRNGAVIEEGPAERLASGKTHSYTRTLFRALPRLTSEQPQRKIARGETLLRVQSLAIRSERGKSTKNADKFSFELRRGASLALIGEEGAGRHKLVRTLIGLEPIRTGRIVVDSVDLGILSSTMKARLRRRVAIITGGDDALDPRMSVRDTVDEPLRAHLRLPRDSVVGHRELAMKRVGLPSHLGTRKVGSLTAFDKRRLQVARAIVSAPMLTIVDEPLRGLDAFAQTIVRDLLADFREQEGSAFLVITSDLTIAQALAEDALVFKDGRVIERGTVHELIRSPKEQSLKTLIEASVPRPAIMADETAS